MKQLILIRGLPGSGKSTLASKIITAEYHLGLRCFKVESDDFYISDTKTQYSRLLPYTKNGKPQYYNWNPDVRNHAHSWCMNKVIQAFFIHDYDVVVVSNTFIRNWEMLPYKELVCKYGLVMNVLEPDTPWAKDPQKCFEKNIHQVPLETIKNMLQKWEELN